jgi:hypothetical protein
LDEYLKFTWSGHQLQIMLRTVIFKVASAGLLVDAQFCHSCAKAPGLRLLHLNESPFVFGGGLVGLNTGFVLGERIGHT